MKQQRRERIPATPQVKTQTTAGPVWTMESQQIVSAGGRYQSGISATQSGYVTLGHGTRVDQKLNLMFSPHL